MIWRGVIEGYYGRPHSHAERLALIAWLGTRGFTQFVHAPKDDPFHRDRWREPYPADDEARWAELVAAGADAGVDVVAAISPGLDWAPGDEPALVAKLERFRELGARGFLVAWDDVPTGGAELGRAHGAAVATARAAVGDDDVPWAVCPTDYALAVPTDYLRALAAEVPAEVPVVWTGPEVVSLRIPAAPARRLAEELGHPVLIWENFPVSDAGMRGVLHLGPYPWRDPELPAVTAGVIVNLAEHPLATRVGVELAGRFWADPGTDPDVAWADAVAARPGLGPLARACRSWIDHPGPDPLLAAWAAAAPADPALRRFLEAGCRSGLAPALADELEPWLRRWDAEAEAMLAALDVLEDPRPGLGAVAHVVVPWRAARRTGRQLFGIRSALYPVHEMHGADPPPDARGVVMGENLTDRLCRRALASLPGKDRASA